MSYKFEQAVIMAQLFRRLHHYSVWIFIGVKTVSLLRYCHGLCRWVEYMVLIDFYNKPISGKLSLKTMTIPDCANSLFAFKE